MLNLFTLGITQTSLALHSLTRSFLVSKENKSTMDTEDLIKQIIQCAYNVRTKLSAGFLESVYRNALLIELHENGLKADNEVPITVHYNNIIVGDFRADIVVENAVIIELKATQHLSSVHEAQLVNYLTATDIEHGLLINFGSEKIEIKRKYKTYKNTKLQ